MSFYQITFIVLSPGFFNIKKKPSKKKMLFFTKKDKKANHIIHIQRLMVNVWKLIQPKKCTLKYLDVF
jgi:hypothetical protein